MRKLFLIFVFSFLPFITLAADLFDAETPVIEGVKVHETSAFFAEVFQKLSDINFAGKDVRVAIESLERLSPKIKIAATDHRIIIVHDSDIIGNWPRPLDNDWKGLGDITTALLLKIRASDPVIASQSGDILGLMAVNSIIHSLDQDGRYIASIYEEDGKVLTSAGIQGKRDKIGNWRIEGVVKGSQADDAGINEGDLIVGINGKDVKTLSDAELAAAFGGLNSGTLKLSVATPTGTKKIVLRRASIVMTDADIVWRQSTSDKQQEFKILEIIIYNVSENAVAIVNEALNKYSDATGIVLDMRAARGGDERAAAKLAGLFLGAVPIMHIEETAGEKLEVIPGGDAITNAPVVVLVSNQTQGSAEAIALAFNDNSRGVLVGTPTAGKAKLITKIELSNGATIELGNKRIKSGQGVLIDKRGVFPLVCLSNIRNKSQEDAFFVNVINGDFNAQNFNSDLSIDSDKIRKGCPNIKSGEDEDAAALAVSTKILTDNNVYKKLLENVSE
jgi:carboxyl-terminal processing protease